MDVLADGVPRSCRELADLSGLGFRQVENAVVRCWGAGLVLRTVAPIYEYERVNLGRRGRSTHVRPFHLYVLAGGLDSAEVGGRSYVGYSREYIDPRGRGGKSDSKSRKILEFLRSNPGEAFYSTVIAARLVDSGVHIRDIMSNARRWESIGQVYIRGYKTNEKQTPFREGYLLTWIDQEKPREVAINEAVIRTDRVLDGVFSSSPTMTRVNRIRDMVLEHTKMRSLVGFTYIEDQLGCSHDQARGAMLRRARRDHLL
jgi:hypothetical protein